MYITYWTASRNENMPGTPISSETITVTGTSAQSSAFANNATYVSIVADVDLFMAYGSDPTADTSSAFVQAGERLWMDANTGRKIAVIAA